MKFILAIFMSLILSCPALACKDDKNYQAALKAWVEHELEKALTLCNEVISEKPDCANAYSLRGSILSEKGEYTEALNDFNKSLKLNPSYVPSYVGRAEVYHHLGQNQKAISDYTHAIYLNHDAYTFYARGQEHKANKEYLKAYIDFSVARFLEPQNIRYLSAQEELMPMALRQDGQNRKRPDYDSKTIRYRAYEYYHSGEIEKAILLWEDILTNGSFINDFDQTLREICRIYAEDCNLDRAETFFMISILYVETFMQDKTEQTSQLYNHYSKYLSQLGKDGNVKKRFSSVTTE